MQLSSNKKDTALVNSLLARTNRFNSCVYLYCYNPPIVTQRRGRQYQFLNKNDLLIDIPSNIPIGQDPRETLIDQASDLLIELLIVRAIP